jgi:hypothetical protein
MAMRVTDRQPRRRTSKGQPVRTRTRRTWLLAASDLLCVIGGAGIAMGCAWLPTTSLAGIVVGAGIVAGSAGLGLAALAGKTEVHASEGAPRGASGNGRHLEDSLLL